MSIPSNPSPQAARRAAGLDRPVSVPRGARASRIDGREILAIFVGGAAGTVLRATLAQRLATDPAAWPWGTFTVNVAAAFLLGFFVTRLQERLPPSGYRRPLLGTGLCGGLSTFSTVQVELLQMIDAGAYGLAVGYAAAGVVAGYVAVHLATAMARTSRVGVRP